MVNGKSNLFHQLCFVKKAYNTMYENIASLGRIKRFGIFCHKHQFLIWLYLAEN